MKRRRDAAYFRGMRHPPQLRIAVALAGLAAMAGCAIGGGERVGGEPNAVAREVTLLDLFGSQSVTPFADEVSRLSEGALQIRVVSAEHGDTDYEAATIQDVHDGRADLAVVGARAWDEFGASAFSALGAPFLVDSYALQERVLTSDVVATMLRELPADLVGIGILPGPLRRPFGRAGALAAPSDFQGLTIGTQQSNVADATLRALGARPQRLMLDADLSPGYTRLDGLELQVAAVESDRLDKDGSHLMTNVNLWPRSLVVFGGAQAAQRLSDDELQILRAAATNVVAVMTGSERSLEEETAANLCRKGNTEFDAATATDLEALHQAVEPVYAGLERDAGTSVIIAEIERLKEQLGEPATEIAACSPPTASAPSRVATELDGAWTMDTDLSVDDPEDFDENWGHWVFVFDRGRFAITQENATSCTWGYGTYAVNGARMSWTFEDGGGIAPNNAMNRPGEYFVFDVSVYRDTLTLAPVEGEISPLNFRAEPWRRLPETASWEHFSTRCPPPTAALSP